jgi:outer membrane protein assembly factor BamD (BamD/ComL family)
MDKAKLYYHASNMADAIEGFFELEGSDPTTEEVEKAMINMIKSFTKFREEEYKQPFASVTRKSQNL